MNNSRHQLRSLPTEIAERLRELRRNLTRWVIIRGLSRWLLLTLGVIALDVLLDRLFKMDFAQRAIMLVVMALVIGGLFVWRVIRPLLSRISDNALLLEIESRHPELKENLISGAQLAQDPDLDAKGVSMDLVNATINRSIELARQSDFKETINRKDFRKNLALLGFGMLVTLALTAGVFQTSFFQTWFNRNVWLTADQWPQATYLEIVGAKDGVLVLPRGIDHRLLVQVTENSRVKDVDVFLELEGAAGRTMHQMKPTGKLNGREHLFVMHNVASEFVLRARGGDDVTSLVTVELVEPPAILDLQMSAVFPAYTRLPGQSLEGPGPHSVLEGSRIEGTARVNKKLRSFVIVFDSGSLELQPGDKDDLFRFELPEENAELAGGQYELQLVDQSGLASTRPGRFVISIKEDTSPKVLASLLGISGLAVPRARIPVSCNALDEYGLKRISFQANWKNSDQENEPATSGQQNVLIAEFSNDSDCVRQHQDVAVLELEPLKLTVGTSFRFLIRARDTCPDPNTGESAEFLLRIVSEEELRADLLRREIEQRKAFQRAYDAQLELMAELQAVTAMKADNSDQEKFDADRQLRMISLSRDQKLIGTNLDAIANRFEEFLVEAQNNRLDEEEKEIVGVQTIADRFDYQIIRPIRALDADLIVIASRGLDNCRRLLDNTSELSDAVSDTAAIQQQILDEMKRIMAAMVDAENFQEVVNKLLEIKRGEDQIRSEINKRKPAENEIFDEEDIFDDD